MLLLQLLPRLAATPPAAPGGTSRGASGAFVQVAGAGLDASFWAGYFTNFFVILIWALFLLAVVVSLRYLSRVSRQRAALRQAAANVQAVREATEADESVERLLLETVAADSLVAERVAKLRGAAQRGEHFDQAAVAEALAAREVAHTSFARHVASVLVLLGLCGAIYGLSNLVRGMGPELRKMQELSRRAPAPPAAGQGGSLDSIQESIGGLIEAMAASLEHTRGAFAASLTGIALSIVLLFTNWYVGRGQTSLLAELEDLTSSHLLLLFKPISPTFELAGAVGSFSAGAEHAASLAGRLDDVVEKTNEQLELLFAIVRKFEEGATAIKEHQQGMADAQVKMLALAEQFTGLTQQIEQHQAGSKEDLSGAFAAVNTNNEYIRQALDDWGGRHQNVLQQLEKIAAQWNADAKELKKETRELLSQEISQFRAQVLEGFERQQKFSQDQLSLMLKEQRQYVADLQAAVLNGQGHKELVEGVNRVFTDEREAFSSRLVESVEQHQQNLLQQLERLFQHQQAGVAHRDGAAVPASLSRGGAGADGGQPQRGELRALAQQQKQMGISVRKVADDAKRLVNVFIQFVSGAGAVALMGGVTAAWGMLGQWPSQPVGQLGAIAVVLVLGGLTFHLISSLLKREKDD